MTTLTVPPTPSPTSEPPLVERLVSVHGATWVDPATLDAFAGQAGDRVLFFSGDPVRFPECLDVAVVLPELQKTFPGRFQVGVVRREGEDQVARVYGAQRWPSLVFLRDSQYVTTISGMLDWTDYVVRVEEALTMAPRRAPIPLMGTNNGPSCH